MSSRFLPLAGSLIALEILTRNGTGLLRNKPQKKIQSGKEKELCEEKQAIDLLGGRVVSGSGGENVHCLTGTCEAQSGKYVVVRGKNGAG